MDTYKAMKDTAFHMNGRQPCMLAGEKTTLSKRKALTAHTESYTMHLCDAK